MSPAFLACAGFAMLREGHGFSDYQYHWAHSFDDDCSGAYSWEYGFARSTTQGWI